MTNRTRTSLTACMAEGAVAEVIAACCGGAAIAAWAFLFGASPTLIGVLWGLSYFSQLLQLPAAWLTSRFGRRRVAILGHASSRLLLLALVPLPFVPLTATVKQAVLVTVFGLSAALVVVGHNAWLTWVSDLVPAPIRGRFFGRRTAYGTALGTIVALAAGHWLDRARAHGGTGRTLAAMAAIGWLAGLVTTWLMTKQHEPGGEDGEPMRPSDLLAPLLEPGSRRLLGYQIVWNAAVGLTASVAAVYMLRELRIGFVGLGLYNATLAAARVFGAPSWGRAIDRFGARPILVLCALGSAFSSALWMFAVPDRLWIIALEAVVTGLLVAGHELAVFALPLAIAPRAGRSVHLAAFAMVAGLAFGLASVGGGAASGVLAVSAVPLGARALFAVSSCGRLLAAAAGLALLEPGARSIGSVARALAGWLGRAASAPARASLGRELTGAGALCVEADGLGHVAKEEAGPERADDR